MYHKFKKSIKRSRKSAKCNKFARNETLKLIHMKQRIVSAVLLAFLTAGIVSAQMARLYTSEWGLANSKTNEIFQDSKGFIWISTENGLMRFDGMDFSTFRFDRNSPNSIASDLVLTVFEDSRGVYWVGTSAGLQTFDVEYNSFTKLDLRDPDNPSSDQHISAITEAVICGEPKIIAASSGHGIYILDPQTHEVDMDMQYVLNSALESQFIRRIFTDSHQRLWVAAEDGGIAVIDLRSGTAAPEALGSTPKKLLDEVMVNAFAENERSGDMLLGSSNYGILIYDSSEGMIRGCEDRNARSCKVESMLRNTVAPQYGDDTYIIGVENHGLMLFDMVQEKLQEITLPTVQQNTSTWKVHSLMEDNQGNVWAGAYQTGVLVIPKSMYGFEYTSLSTSYGHGDNSACVTSVIEDGRGNLWVGTDGGGLFRIDKNGRKTSYSSENTSLSNNSIMSLAIDKRGTLWIATYLGGLVSWSEQTGFRQFRDQASLNTNKTVSLAYSWEEDVLYVGTHGNGLSIISLPQEKVIRNFAEDDNKWISTLYIDNAGLLWVGTYNGPMCYDHRVRKLIQYDVYDFLSTRIQSFCESADGKIWIGTGEGIVSFDRQTKQTVSYSENDGLPSNVIADIQEGNDGNLWISTLNGLSRFNPTTREFKNYYHHDGLQENEFHSKASYRSKDGKLYFGGIKGLTSFYPHIVDQRTHPVPPLYFSDLRVMNEPVSYDPLLGDGNILDKHITEATQITLPSYENIFSVKFSVLEYTNPRKIAYAYRMEGFDEGWNHTGADSRVVTYTNLPSGRYTMQVKAYFEGEPDEFSYREIGIRILPPWYRTVWAYILYLLLGAAAVLAVREYRKKLEVQRQEKEESEIKELKLRMFTNISHEIRTPLTLVMSPLKKMRESETEPKQKELYNLMYRNCLRILRLVNQLLDMRKIDNGQMQLHFLETDVVYFIRDIMQSFDNLAVSKNVSFHMEPEQEVTNLWIDQGNFDKIIFNILSNAFKYTPDGGEISIRVSRPTANNGVLQATVKEYVEFTIENSGSMVEEQHLDRLFDRYFQVDVRDAKVGSGVGLNLAKMLVELHHGDIRAYNTESGMAFSVRIPVGCGHLTAEEMTKPTNHKDLYTKDLAKTESHEDVTFNPEEASDEKARQTKSKRTIVLVDDDSEMRAYLRLELQSLYNVVVCANGKEAWGIISTTVPDAVITDLMMDGMDGAELCGKIKKNPGTNHIPVLILTSSSDEQSVQRCTNSGADRFFTKPISLEILKGAIANAISTRDTIRNKYSKDINYGYGEMQMHNSSNHLIDKVIKAIRENIENTEFGVEELSREVGLSRVHLNRKLKETMNISPSNLIRSIRLKQAAYLLINNKVNISEVAYKVGFSSHSYFSNSFHDYFGLTPKEFVAKYMDCKDEETLKRIFD